MNDTPDTAQPQFWRKYRPGDTGTAFRYETAAQLWDAACEAFDWLDAHPLREEVIANYKGTFSRTVAKKMRPYTWEAVALLMGLSVGTLKRYGSRPGFEETIEWLTAVIRTQKFEGAAANLLNPVLIARDLGMAERMEHTGKDGGPIKTADATDEEKLYDEARRLGIDPTALGLGGSVQEA